MASRTDGKNERSEVSFSIKLASAMIAVFCALNAIDAYTTEVGLSKGGREINAISAFVISTVGVQGYVIGKLVVSLLFVAISIVVWRSWHRMNEYVFDFYLVLSLALLVGGVAAVLNNLIVLSGI